jgi:16S rRNA (uracil1498-N3)-methyltransferase
MKPQTADDQYFFVHPADVNKPHSITLRGEEAHHCIKVLRKAIGSRFYAVDGQGNEYLVELTHAHKDSVECSIIESRLRPTELAFNITLAQALIKKDHFDLAVEKCTELGVSRIIPLETSRSLAEPGKNKIERWQKIILSAMKQSRRSVLPQLTAIVSLKDLVEKSNVYDLKILFHEKSNLPVFDFVKTLPHRPEQILILIGPEGGFTDSEVAMAVDHGFISLSLGQRRLRAETAAICGVSIFSNIRTPQNT